MKNKKKILIIDGNNTLYRAHYSHLRMSFNGHPTSCIYGVLSILRSVIKRFNPDDVYICWDGEKHPERMKLNEGYKGHRQKLTDDKILINKQKTPLMDLIYYLGVKQVYEKNMEADDWIYILFRKLALKEKHELVIVSADKDFHQLLRSNVTIWQDDTRKKLLLTKHNLKSHHNYTPKEAASYLALTGDKGDDIAGVGGIGPANARKILDKHTPEELPKVLVNGTRDKYLRNMIMIHLKTFYLLHLKGMNHKMNYYRGLNKRLYKSVYKEEGLKFGLKMFTKKSFIKTFSQLHDKWAKK